MKSMIQTGLVAILAVTFLTATAWAQTKPTAKQVTKPSATASKPVVDTEFGYPAATGAMPCDSNVTVTVSKDAKRSDGFVVAMGKTSYPTTRVATDSGAIRLENKASGIVWLQMANKSMLFNEKAGKRLANNCRNDAQVAAEKSMTTSTASSAFDAPPPTKP
jgi:hypothetical protein